MGADALAAIAADCTSYDRGVAEPRYPLARVRELRADTATERTRALATALAALADAESAVLAIEARRARLRGTLTDATALTAPAPAWALAQRDAYASRLRRDLAAIDAALTTARALVATRTAEVETARTATAHARAERDTVDRHRADWNDAQRKARDRRED